MSIKPIKKAVFPVAGLGTRFLPATKAMPKEMLTVCDRPLIQHVVEEAREAGIEEFIFITGRSKELLEEHFDLTPELEDTLTKRGKFDVIETIKELLLPDGSMICTRQHRPLGLGHAIWLAKQIVGDEPFAVILPDVLVKAEKGNGCMKQMIDVYNETGGNLIAVEDVPIETVDQYGIVEPGTENGKAIEVKGLVEKPNPADAPSQMSVIGRYILQPEVFEHLGKHEKGAGGEIQLTDALDKLIKEQAFNAMRFDGKTHDSGNRLGFITANLAYAIDDDKIGKDVEQMILDYAAEIKGRKNVAAAK